VPRYSNGSRNTRRPRRTLTNAEALERVVRFLETGDIAHLPPALRPEAPGIIAFLLASVQEMPGEPAWPGSAAGPHPPAGASFAAEYRALAGDDLADADSGLLDE
jgi:hypothetical protein